MSRWRRGLLFVLGAGSVWLSMVPRWFPWRWEISVAAAAVLAGVMTSLLPHGWKRRSLLVWALVGEAVLSRTVRPHVPEAARSLFDFLVLGGIALVVWWSFFYKLKEKA